MNIAAIIWPNSSSDCCRRRRRRRRPTLHYSRANHAPDSHIINPFFLPSLNNSIFKERATPRLHCCASGAIRDKHTSYQIFNGDCRQIFRTCLTIRHTSFFAFSQTTYLIQRPDTEIRDGNWQRQSSASFWTYSKRRIVIRWYKWRKA